MCHRPLHSYMDIKENSEDYHRRPTFPELFVIKLLVTQGTTRYQMKDMDIIFLLIPLSLLWVEWFGYYSLSKSSIFSKCSKMLEIDQFCSEENFNFWATFFQKAVIRRRMEIWTWNQSHMKLRILNFQNKKEAYWYLKPLLSYWSLKIGRLW